MTLPRIPNIPLNTGHPIPQLGLGTYKLSREDTPRIVEFALSKGCRHIDTAQMYGNESEVGQAIAASGIPREDVFLTTKLDNSNHEPAAARESFAASLKLLGTDYVDLFLIHWPLPDQYGGDFLTTWKVLEEFAADGRARSIGVSNFQKHHLETLIEGSDTVPAIDQIELHPYLSQEPLRALHNSLGVVTESWSPLGRGRLLNDPVVADTAAALGVAPAQVVVRWHLQHDLVVIPKTTHRERMVTNADVFSFALSDGQMAALDALDRGLRTGSHPDRVQEV